MLATALSEFDTLVLVCVIKQRSKVHGPDMGRASLKCDRLTQGNLRPSASLTDAFLTPVPATRPVPSLVERVRGVCRGRVEFSKNRERDARAGAGRVPGERLWFVPLASRLTVARGVGAMHSVRKEHVL